MSLALESPVTYPLNELVLIPVNKLKIDGNCRYGWEKERILPAYEKGLSELIESIELWGFYPDKPVLFYLEKNEETGEDVAIIEDGRRRALAALNIYAEDESFVFVEGEQPGAIWGIRVEKPATLEQQLSGQSSRNTGLPNTNLDIAKMCYLLSQEPKYKELKTKKALAIGKALGFSDISDQAITNKVNLYLRVWDALSTDVKDWIQEGELDALDEGFPKLSWYQTTLTVNEYEKYAKRVLSEVLTRCQANLADVEKKGGIGRNTKTIRGEYIDQVAAELGIVGKTTRKQEKEKAKEKPASTPVNPPTHSTSESSGLPSEKFNQDEPQEPDTSLIADDLPSLQSKSIEEPVSTKENPERLGAQILKLIKSGKVGLILAGFEHNVSDNVYYSQVGLDTEEITEFDSFLELVNRYIDGSPTATTKPTEVVVSSELDGLEF